MLLDSFTGNKNIKESLLGALASGRLSHGLLLCGEKGLGVNRFAWLLAGDIIGTQDLQRLKDGKNPQVISISGEGASGMIRVDKIRQLNEDVSYSSIAGEKRVVIIHNCENFNTNSANALLKNLEEPKNDTTYILTTNNSCHHTFTLPGLHPAAAFCAAGFCLFCPEKCRQSHGGQPYGHLW